MNKTKKPTRKSPAKPKIKPIAEKPSKPAKLESTQSTSSDQQPQTPVQEQMIKPSRRASVTPSSSKTISVTATSQNISSNIITVASPQRGTSLLLSNNLPKQQQVVEVTTQQPKTQVQINEQQNVGQEQSEKTKENKEINEALQAIIQNRVSSPTIKTSECRHCTQSVIFFQGFFDKK